MTDNRGSTFVMPCGDMTGYAPSFGLTRREWFAGLAMQGMIAGRPEMWPDRVARESVAVADALLAKLAKEPPTATAPAPRLREGRDD